MVKELAIILAVLMSVACGEVQKVEVPSPEFQAKTAPTPTPVDLASRSGPVNDEQSAIAIALAAWIPVYGREQIESERPYSAVLSKGVWEVTGYLPENTVGGTAVALISQKDGRVIKIYHEE